MSEGIGEIFTPPVMNALNEAIEKAVNARMEIIEANRTKLIEAFIAETGLNPRNAVMCVEQKTSTGFRLWFRAKTEKEMAGGAENLRENPEL